MNYIKTFESFLNEANAFNNFSSEEKKAWKKSENRLGKTYFVPKDEKDYKRMMEFLEKKGWAFWNAYGVDGYDSEEINISSLPEWKPGVGFELGGTKTGDNRVIPTKMTATTQGAEFDAEEFFNTINESFLNERRFPINNIFANEFAKIKKGNYKKIKDIKQGELVYCGEDLNRQTQGKFIAKFRDLGNEEISLHPVYSESLGFDEDENNSSIISYEEAEGGFNVIELKDMPKK